jgi:hypothetical protein
MARNGDPRSTEFFLQLASESSAFWLGPKQAGIQHTGDGLVGLGGFGEGGIFPNATQASYSPSKYSRAYISRS